MSSDIPERCTARALVSGCVSKGLLVATKYINEDNNKQNSLLLNFHPNTITFQQYTSIGNSMVSRGIWHKYRE